MNKLAMLLATWFGSGLIPPILLKGMAGAYGSFFSLPLCAGMMWWGSKYPPFSVGSWLGTIAVFVLLFIGLWSVPRAEKILGPCRDWHGRVKAHDQNQIVIDEVLGMVFACYPLLMFAIPPSWLNLAAVFLLFRFFDIVKIPPAGFVDRHQHNELGVMLDDLIAGFYAALVIMFLHLY